MTWTNDRPRRVHVRAPCDMRIAGQTVTGISHNLSTSGAHLSFPRDKLNPSEVQLDGEYEVRLLLPGQSAATRAWAEVVWMNDAEVDAGNRPVTGVGMRFVRCTNSDQHRLSTFIQSFRYPLAVVYPNVGDVHHVSALLEHDYLVLRADSIESALDHLRNHAVAAVISGYSVQELEDHGLLEEIRATTPQPQILIDTVESTESRLSDFIRLGTELHYLGGETDPHRLRGAVQRAVDAYALAAENEQLRQALHRANERLRSENEFLRQRVSLKHGFGEIIGQSDALRRAIDELVRVQNTDVTVHIHGETGTGKELVARALHNGGPRADKPFVAQNCAGFPESLLQSTLFGHVKGAFTGADRDRDGVFQAAHGGTLFLDEVGELSPTTQAMLLRALQDGEVTPVGANSPITVDVRLISATHRDLAEAVAAKDFREDLYYRLMVMSVELPPLRERKGDIALLACHFLDVYCARHRKNHPGFTAEAMSCLEAHTWPGNVRELENEIERAVILTPDGQKIHPAALSRRTLAGARGDSSHQVEEVVTKLLKGLHPEGSSLDHTLQQVEAQVLQRVLDRCDGNRSQAARELGIPRQTLLSRLARYGIPRDPN